MDPILFDLKNDCKALKAKFKQKYNEVTEEDLQCNNGNKVEMLDKIQQRLGKTVQEVHDIILNL